MGVGVERMLVLRRLAGVGVMGGAVVWLAGPRGVVGGVAIPCSRVGVVGSAGSEARGVTCGGAGGSIVKLWSDARGLGCSSAGVLVKIRWT